MTVHEEKNWKRNENLKRRYKVQRDGNTQGDSLTANLQSLSEWYKGN